MKIEQNKVVALSYKLEADGDVIEVVTSEKPMEFLYGVGYLLPKFEDQIKDMKIGDTFDFVLSPTEAYGEIEEDAIIDMSKSVFEVDGKFDDEYIQVGQSVPMQDEEGGRLYGVVEEITDTTVKMNFNHPLAGSALHFSGAVVAVREATPEDLAGGCSCGCECDSDCECDEEENCGCGCGCE